MSTTVESPWGTFRPRPVVSALIAASRTTPVGRGSGRRLIGRAIDALQPGPLDVRLWDLQVRLHHSHNVCERKALLRPDHMDAVERRYLREVMASPGAVFVDIGANVGLYALHAAQNCGDGARIVVIEPQATLLARLRYNLALARLNGQIVDNPRFFIHELAVGEEANELFLSDSDGSEGSRTLVGSTAGTLVKVRPLAEILAHSKIDRVDIIKIDIEGYEDRALIPFFQKQHEALFPRHVIIEHVNRSMWQHDCLDVLASLGFSIVLHTRNNTILARYSAKQ